MKRLSQLATLTAATLLLVACANNTEKPETTSTLDTIIEKVEVEEVISDIDVEGTVAMINALRADVEARMKELDRKEMSTEGMRPQIKQKWSMMHVYRDGDKVVRIKTYPYASISNRTEEFYFNDGELALAVIKDDESAEAGQGENITKMYYYSTGEVIREINKSDEPETTIKDSDGERLLQEAKEYLTQVTSG